MNFLKGTALYSVLTGNCPVCHKESMYIAGNPYRLSLLFEMNERCSHCNTKYKMEPSFFYGAMYVSYGVGVALGTFVFLISHLIFGLGLLVSFFLIAFSVIGLLPVIMRLSRNIWINLFLSFKKL